jgi:hypothetical protein
MHQGEFRNIGTGTNGLAERSRLAVDHPIFVCLLHFLNQSINQSFPLVPPLLKAVWPNLHLPNPQIVQATVEYYHLRQHRNPFAPILPWFFLHPRDTPIVLAGKKQERTVVSESIL